MTTAGQKVTDVIDTTVEKTKELAQDAKELVSKGADRAREAAPVRSRGAFARET